MMFKQKDTQIFLWNKWSKLIHKWRTYCVKSSNDEDKNTFKNYAQKDWAKIYFKFKILK